MVEIRNQPITNNSHISSTTNKDLIVELAIPSPIFKNFDYLVDNKESVEIGSRVLAPFGKANRQIVGIVLKIKTNSEFDVKKLKYINKIIDNKSLLEEEHIKLLSWASYYYKYPLGQVLEAAIPSYLRKDNSFDKLIPKKTQNITKDNKVNSSLQTEDLNLTNDQSIALDKIKASIDDFNVFCLYGVTGSGKTEVYLQAIESIINKDKQALVLIPEIGLSPQTVNRFSKRFPKQTIAVLNSKVSEKQRALYWYQAITGKAKIIIGTRSAALVPLYNPGIIIIDEEHDNSFKQQDKFRYFAKDYLIKKAHTYNIPIILGSATPSLETLYNVEKGKYKFLSMPRRVDNSSPPQVEVLDIRHNKLQAGISSELLAKIKNHLDNKGQIILFLNRRGFAPALFCLDCSWISICKNCDANLIVHYKKNSLVCHHCNITDYIPKDCPNCDSKHLVPVGVGTERVYEKLKEIFPNKNILRLDKDTTTSKFAMDEHLQDIQDRKVDIIIGTQMIAKGHHFDNITLVGILDIDAAFFSTDFRAIEKIGQLIVQVSGRAGREGKKSEVFLQTSEVENKTLQSLISQNYLEFAKNLLNERSIAKLPPYSFQALFRAESRYIQYVMEFLSFVKHKLNSRDLMLLGPVPAPMQRKKNTYRAQLLIQADSRKTIHTQIDQIIAIIAEANLKKFNRVKWSLDIDPQDLY